MICDMCGKNGELFRAEIEGTKLNVCKNCAKHGKIIAPLKQEVKKEPRKTAKEPEETNKIYIVSDDFAEKIRKKREIIGMNQEDFAKRISEKESIVHKLETGEFRPSLKMARKLEKELGIDLIESYEEKQENLAKPDTQELTLGDVIKLKKKS